ncbi:DUF192 domain-containing protein [Candidatus Curtissbacteria bacterium]|nr:DUF192 domain-containing protein [Candidatus Curtissbacteria bacterium]
MASCILSGDGTVKKDLAIIFGLFLLIAILVVFGRGYTSGGLLTGQGEAAVGRKGFTAVTIKDLSVNARVASLASERKKGLSGQNSLPMTDGLLFVFENSGLYPFWMKDMKFAVDIIWIDENKTVVYIVNNAPFEPDRDSDELTLYRPTSAAKYVLEINAGLAQRYGIVVGDLVNFKL